MSFYFSQLIATSAIGSRNPHAPRTTVPHAVDSSATGLQEITHQVESIAPPAQGTVPVPQTAPPDPKAPEMPTTQLEAPPLDRTQLPKAVHKRDSVNEPAESSESARAVSRSGKPSPDSPLPEVIEVVQRPSDPPHGYNAGTSSEEALAAVMKWVAAAETQNSFADERGSFIDTPSETNATTQSSLAREEPPSRPIAARVETIIRESSPSPAPTPPAAAKRPSATQSPREPVGPTTPSVSIGSVHLRIEAPPAPTPPPATPPLRPHPSRTGRSPDTKRASELMKLRRHYILPH